VPDKGHIDDILNAARATKNIDLQAKIAQGTELMDRVERISALPLDQQRALETELQRRIRTGNTDSGTEIVEKQLSQRTEAITKGLQENPIATAVTSFPDKFKTPAPLNMQDPQQLIAGLQQRAQIAGVAQHNWQTGPLSVLDKGDVADMKVALSNPDPAVKAGIDGAIATLEKNIQEAQEELRQNKIYTVWKNKFGLKTNLGSHEQLGKIIFDELKYESRGKTATAKHKTDEEAFAHVKLPFLRKYFRVEKWKKAKGTYLEGIRRELTGLVQPQNASLGKFHRWRR
jgi:hypothetical protein